MKTETRTRGICVRAVSAPLPARLPSAGMPQEILPMEGEIPEMESSMEPLPALPASAEASPDYLAGISGAIRTWQHKGSLRRWAEVLAVEVETLKIFLEHKRVCGQIRNQDLSDEYVRGTSEYGIEVNRLKIAQLRKAREGLEQK